MPNDAWYSLSRASNKGGKAPHAESVPVEDEVDAGSVDAGSVELLFNGLKSEGEKNSDFRWRVDLGGIVRREDLLGVCSKGASVTSPRMFKMNGANARGGVSPKSPPLCKRRYKRNAGSGGVVDGKIVEISGASVSTSSAE